MKAVLPEKLIAYSHSQSMNASPFSDFLNEVSGPFVTSS